MNITLSSAQITTQRFSRLSLWLCLTIMRFAARALAPLGPHAARRALSAHARTLRLLLVAGALTHIVRGAHSPAPHHVATRGLTVRRVVGSVLRRAMRRGTLGEHAKALCSVLAAPARWIAAIARRLRRQFTKLRSVPKPPRARLSAVACAPRIAAVRVNSS
jgi:hypothetical protein